MGSKRLPREEVLKAARSLNFKTISDVDRGEAYKISEGRMHELVKEFLKDRFEGEVEGLLDDPSFMTPDYRFEAPSVKTWGVEKWIAMFVLTAKFLELNFWDMCEQLSTDVELSRLQRFLEKHKIEWGWQPPTPQVMGEPKVMDISNEEMKHWCFRFDTDKETHYGPIKAVSVPKLLEQIKAYYPWKSVEQGIQFWQTNSKDYLYPPKAGSGVTIYAFDSKAGWRPLKQA